MLRFKSLCHASRTGPSSGKGLNNMQSSMRRLLWSIAALQHGMPHVKAVEVLILLLSSSAGLTKCGSESSNSRAHAQVVHTWSLA